MTSTALTRRTLLTLAAASASLAACDRCNSGSKTRVAVIGGGIIGASIAYHLAEAGADVSLLERGELAGRASRGTFAWINASWAKQPRAYHSVNQAGVSGWHRLEEELGLGVRWGGSLEWFGAQERQAKLADQIAEQAEWGEPAQMLPRDQLELREPNVNFGEASNAALSGNDGAVDPVAATLLLVEAAKRLGADVRTGCEVHSVTDTEASHVRLETSSGNLLADRYVVATGASVEAPLKLAGIDIPQRSTPGVIVVTRPLPQLINHIIVAPGVHIHQREDGRVVLGEQDGAPQTEAHDERLRDRPNRFPDEDLANQHAARILAIAVKFVPRLADADIDDVFIGWRPLPLDGHPVLGPSLARPQSYLAIMHSGVTLAPIVGELAAKEILSGVLADELALYRPDRAFEGVQRY